MPLISLFRISGLQYVTGWDSSDYGSLDMKVFINPYIFIGSLRLLTSGNADSNACLDRQPWSGGLVFRRQDKVLLRADKPCAQAEKSLCCHRRPRNRRRKSRPARLRASKSPGAPYAAR